MQQKSDNNDVEVNKPEVRKDGLYHISRSFQILIFSFLQVFYTVKSSQLRFTNNSKDMVYGL